MATIDCYDRCLEMRLKFFLNTHKFALGNGQFNKITAEQLKN